VADAGKPASAADVVLQDLSTWNSPNLNARPRQRRTWGWHRAHALSVSSSPRPRRWPAS